VSSDSTVHAAVVAPYGKHYGTEIVVRHPQGHTFTFMVSMPVGDPSDNELAGMGTTRPMWEANAEVIGGWGVMVPVQSEFCFDHYQSAFELAVAERIASSLDGMLWEDG
jgi:hypothetical protein